MKTSISDKDKKTLFNLFTEEPPTEIKTWKRKIAKKYHADQNIGVQFDASICTLVNSIAEKDLEDLIYDFNQKILINDLNKSKIWEYIETYNNNGTHVTRLKLKYDGITFTIPDGIQIICGGAFWIKQGYTNENEYINAPNLVIPKSVAKICINAFRFQNVIKTLTFEHGEEGSVEIYSGAFSRCSLLSDIKLPTNTILYYSTNNDAEVIFSECESLVHLTLPSNLTITNHGRLSKLTPTVRSFTVTSSEPKYTFEGNGSPDNEYAGHVEAVQFTNASLAILPHNFFRHCKNLSKVTGLNNLKAIGDETFYNCESLTDIDIPQVETIGTYAFKNCNSLSVMVIPNVKIIGDYAFANCKHLSDIETIKRITYKNNNTNDCNNSLNSDTREITIGNHTFENCESLKNICLNYVTSIGDSTFEGCTNLETINLPHVTKIGNSAFANCTRLRYIHIPKVVEIGELAFENCTDLSEIEIPDTINIVGASIFQNCKNLVSVRLSAMVSGLIKDNAFEGCSLSRMEIINFTNPLLNVLKTKDLHVEQPFARGITNLTESFELPEGTKILSATLECHNEFFLASLASLGSDSISINVFNSTQEEKTVCVDIKLLYLCDSYQNDF